MARPVRGCLMPQSWQGGTEEPEIITSVPQQEEQADTTEYEVIADYNPDIDYEPEESDTEIEAVNEEEENSAAVYSKMELPQEGTLHQRTMNHKVSKWIECIQ